MMAYTAKNAVNELYPNRRPYIINRAGYSGIQRYAQTWAGDNLTSWKTLKYDIQRSEERRVGKECRSHWSTYR